MTLKPFPGRVIIKALEDDIKTQSGIIIPEIAKKQSIIGEIVFANEQDEDVKVGDRVIFRKYGPEEITIENEKLLVCDLEDVVAVIVD